MIILTNLTAVKTEGEYNDPGVRQTVHHSPEGQRGVIRQISMGPNGIVVSRGALKVAIPMTELLRLADEAEPNLAAVPAVTAQTRRVQTPPTP